MKLTIEIENDQIGHLTAEQISILKDHISRMIERYVDWVMDGGDKEFLVRLVETSMESFSFELDI